jgi:hypothetical protein
MDFVLEPAPFTQTVTVEGGMPAIGSDSTAVSTAISRQFVENLPLNGRTFQPLLACVPGITSTNSDGQFSTNGQRDNTNYFTVDGVSANVGLSNFRNLGETGSIPPSMFSEEPRTLRRSMRSRRSRCRHRHIRPSSAERRGLKCR